MIETKDLQAAVGAGIISERQAASLVSLAHSRLGARENLSPGDEPFELFRGFNEIFIVMGLVILSMGWGITAAAVSSDYSVMITGVLGAGLLALLSDYFIRNRRMVAPAIALSILFALNAAATLLSYFAEPFMVMGQDFDSLALPLALSTLALVLYWLRYKVPFAMMMIATGLFAVALVFAANQSGTPHTPQDIFLLSAGGPFAWITLVLGLAVFAVAMMFDMSDPHRVTRRSANGFWLHVVAAPALVNTVALSLMEQDTTQAYLMLMGFLALFALVAVVIDRRSFLMAAIGYCVTLIITFLDGGIGLSILLLGTSLLLLGAKWERIRAFVLRQMPGFIPLHRLPPSIQSRD